MTEEEKTAMEMYSLFKKLSPGGKEAVIKRCSKIGANKLANALRQVADESKAHSPKAARQDVALPSVVLPCEVTL